MLEYYIFPFKQFLKPAVFYCPHSNLSQEFNKFYRLFFKKLFQTKYFLETSTFVSYYLRKQMRDRENDVQSLFKRRYDLYTTPCKSRVFRFFFFAYIHKLLLFRYAFIWHPYNLFYRVLYHSYLNSLYSIIPEFKKENCGRFLLKISL